MADLLYHLICLLFFDIPLLYYMYYYINLISSTIFYLFSEDIHLSLSISSFVFELFGGEVLETFVILSATLFPIKPPVPSAFFWIVLFEAISSASVADFLAWSRSFWLYLLLKFLFMFLTYISSKRQKSIVFYKYSISWLNLAAYHFFICCTLINN